MTTHSRALLFLLVVAATEAASSLVAQNGGLPDTVTLNVPGRVSATPWVAALDSHVAVTWGAGADGKTDVFVAVSTDGGRTFGEPRQVNAIAGEARLGGELPPRVALRAREALAPGIVVLWTARGERTDIKMSRSLDGGRTFAGERTLQSSDAAGDRGWPALTLDSSGVAHAIWLDHRGLAQKRTSGGAEAAHKHQGEHDGVAMAQRSALHYASSGTSPAGERALAPGVCYCCKTAFVAGPTGTLFAAWRHVYAGNLRDIAFTSSSDGGASFAQPTRVSEDRWQLNGCPDDGPAMAVDHQGTVHVVWPTVIDGAEPQGALFYATSRDNGRTFSPRVRVPTQGSPKPAHPQITVDSTGRALIAWDEVLNGVRRAFVREARHDPSQSNEVVFSETVVVDQDGPSMYPVLAIAARTRVVVWTAGPPGSTVIKVRRL